MGAGGLEPGSLPKPSSDTMIKYGEERKVGFYYNITCYQLQENESLYNQQLNNNKGKHHNKETIIIMKLSNNNNIIYVNISHTSCVTSIYTTFQ